MLKSKRQNRIIFFIIVSLAVHVALVITVSLYHRKKSLEMEKEQFKPLTVFVEQLEEPEPEATALEPPPEKPPQRPPVPEEHPQQPPAPPPEETEPPPEEPSSPARGLPAHQSPAEERPSPADRSSEPDATGEPGSHTGSAGSAAGSGRDGGEGTGSGSDGTGPSMEDRFAELLTRIERYKSGAYPLSARKLGLKGTVIVRLTLDASGALTALSIAEECPHRSLNEAALKLVRRVLQNPYTHGLGSPVRLTIPIVFKLD